MNYWSILMEPLVTLLLILAIFGGIAFLVILIFFWIRTILRNRRIRRRNKRILDAAVHSFVEHYQHRTA